MQKRRISDLEYSVFKTNQQPSAFEEINHKFHDIVSTWSESVNGAEGRKCESISRNREIPRRNKNPVARDVWELETDIENSKLW